MINLKASESNAEDSTNGKDYDDTFTELTQRVVSEPPPITLKIISEHLKLGTER